MNIRDPNIPLTLGAFRALQDEVRRLDDVLINAYRADICPACGSDCNERDELIKAEREIDRLRAKPLMLNGLTEAETSVTASVAGLTTAQQADPQDLAVRYPEGYLKGHDTEVTPEMLRYAQMTDLGGYICANMSGGYALITEMYQAMRTALAAQHKEKA